MAKSIGDASYVAELLTDLGHGARADLVRLAATTWEHRSDEGRFDERHLENARQVLLSCTRYRECLKTMKGTVYARTLLTRAITKFKEEMDD